MCLFLSLTAWTCIFYFPLARLFFELLRAPKDATNANLLVLLHGLYGSSRNLRTLGRKIVANASNSFSVALVDLRNHGASPHCDSHSIRDMSDDVFAFIQSQNARKVVLCGHSMGGRVAMNMATQSPNSLLQGLVLLDISPFSRSLDKQTVKSFHLSLIQNLRKAANFNSISKCKRYLLECQYGNELVEWMVGTNFFTSPDAEKVQIRLNLDALETFIDHHFDVGANSPPQGLGGAYKFPFRKSCLFIKGGKSNYITERDFCDINYLFPKNRIVEFPSAGHWVHSNFPAEIALEVVTLLQEI